MTGLGSSAVAGVFKCFAVPCRPPSCDEVRGQGVRPAWQACDTVLGYRGPHACVAGGGPSAPVVLGRGATTMPVVREAGSFGTTVGRGRSRLDGRLGP